MVLSSHDVMVDKTVLFVMEMIMNNDC